MTKPASNSVEGKAQPFLTRIENLLGDLDSLRGKYMSDCEVVREDIKEVYAEAKEAGVPTRALKGLVKYRKLERDQDKIADGFDLDEQSAYESLVGALGDFADTALGRAAVSKAKPKEQRAEAH